ncbi:TonB-dependent receptor [Devosia sp. MC532]|uniref:TonB-dependent receptor plug domain-containing protein n=1 Tax=Devosia sp. MC532 TaxID=2799788 RepID=UPI0018F4404D|nr:TonB-dependent receptor [Devosia sp. MC532]MBJ7579328.1 TonB-dependent receptor [Devosia sp. MC532]
MFKLNMTLLSATAIASLLTFGTANAQETLLGPVVVSAGLTPVAANEVGRSYTLINSDTINRAKVPYVADLLKQVPGLSVSTSGSAGANTQVRMRGAEGNHVLVLIDGVPVSETSTGEFDFGRLQVSNIESVEILRGPQSAFWGSNAMAGVINIITKAGSRDGIRTTLATEFGTDGTKMGNAQVTFGQDNFDITSALSARHTDGFNVSSFGNELDGASHIDANIRFNANVSQNLRVDGNLRYGSVHADLDSEDWTSGSATYGKLIDTYDTTRTEEFLAALGYNWESDDGAFFHGGRFSGTKVDRETFDTNGVKNGAHTGSRYKSSFQLGHKFNTPDFSDAEHTLTLGYDLVAETFKRLPPNALDEQKRNTQSIVGEYRGRFADQLNLTAAVRHDINDQFANVTTYSLSGSWEIPNSDTTLHASLGTGSTNPTFVEQFGYNPSSFVGNANLKPETSIGWDIGVSQSLLDGLITLDATYFNQNLENEIKSIGWSPATVENDTGLSTRQGIELTAALDFSNGFTASGSYTYTDSRDGSGVTEIRRPKHSGVINLAYDFEEIPLRLNTDLMLVGEADDTDFATSTNIKLPGYALLNAGINYEVSENVEVYARVQNLLNVSYQNVLGYNNAGRTFYVGAKASF